MDALVSRLGDIAHAYQENGWADVEFLNAFDSDVLADLDLHVSGDNGKALTIAYSLDAKAGTHTLAVSQNDYEYELNAISQFDKTNFALQKNALYEQYQEVLLDTTRSYKAGEFSGGVGNIEAAEFFLDGLEAILSPLDIEKDVASAVDESDNQNVNEATGVAAGTKIASNADGAASDVVVADSQTQPVHDSTEKAFLSGLPDFTASFNTPEFLPNASDASEVSQMTLNLEQVTAVSISPSSGVKTLNQSYSYDSRVSQHFGIGGDSVEHANLADVSEPGGQSYLYEVVEHSVTLARTVEIDPDGGVVAYQEDKDTEHFKTTKEVIEGDVTGLKKEDLSDPRDTYSFSLQMSDALTGLELNASQIESYRDIQILNEAIQSQRINLYS